MKPSQVIYTLRRLRAQMLADGDEHAAQALEIAASAAEAEQDGARLQRSGSRVSMPVGRTKGAKVHGAPRLGGIVGRLADTAARNA